MYADFFLFFMVGSLVLIVITPFYYFFTGTLYVSRGENRIQGNEQNDLNNEGQDKDESNYRNSNSNSTGGVTVVFIVVGMGVGLLIVRGFMLDPAEEFAWRIFWHELFRGNVGAKGMGEVFKSATFVKSLVGVFIGGVLGALIGVKYSALKQQAEGKVGSSE